jgi:glycosyltransferase involved in cell wall biosynthesis
MQPELSIVMPCLNEAHALAQCIAKAQAFLKEHDIAGEIIVADNGSRDGSVGLANRMGARVVTVETRGYGAALAGGIEAAQGKYVIIGDSDGSYDFSAQSRGMEFALEMVVKARLHGPRITEIPITLSPDARGRRPHLRWHRDGWRSLRFYLLMSPRWFFGTPGSGSATDRRDRLGCAIPWPDLRGVCYL